MTRVPHVISRTDPERAAALLTLALASASAAVGQPFTTLQAPFTQGLYGTHAFAPNGDV
jgi:hypothetical protein